MHKNIDSVNSKSFYELVNNYKIDFIINSANQIYSKNITRSLNAKIINRHKPSSAIWRYIQFFGKCLITKNMEEDLHWIDEKVDKGEIAYQENSCLMKANLCFNITKQLEISLKLCNELIQDLNNDKVIMIDSNLWSYYSWPSKDDVKNFKNTRIKSFDLILLEFYSASSLTNQQINTRIIS